LHLLQEPFLKKRLASPLSWDRLSNLKDNSINRDQFCADNKTKESVGSE
jgi:hypothetical protein